VSSEKLDTARDTIRTIVREAIRAAQKELRAPRRTVHAAGSEPYQRCQLSMLASIPTAATPPTTAPKIPSADAWAFEARKAQTKYCPASPSVGGVDGQRRRRLDARVPYA
jgi:hypothetical protein